MNPEQIKQMIENGIDGSEVHVEGDGHHFEAVVICKAFDGKNTLQRHRMVHDALGERMGREIHALSMRTFTPAEWNEAGAR